MILIVHRGFQIDDSPSNRQRHGRGRGDFHEIGLDEEMENVDTEEPMPMPIYRRMPLDRGTITTHEHIHRGGVVRRLSAPLAPPRRDSTSSPIPPSFASPSVTSPYNSSSSSAIGTDDKYAGGYRL
ncbi:hypothetical protein AKJ16_DCAP12515 [Drosera capensis]